MKKKTFLSMRHNKLPLSTKTALCLNYASFRQNTQERLQQKDTQLSHFLRFLPCAPRTSWKQTSVCRPACRSWTWTQRCKVRNTLIEWVTQTRGAFQFARTPSTEQVAMQSKIHHSIIHSISLPKLTSERQINNERQWRGSAVGFISLFDLHNPKNTEREEEVRAGRWKGMSNVRGKREAEIKRLMEN